MALLKTVIIGLQTGIAIVQECYYIGSRLEHIDF
jgi:hypothetical protein